MTENEYRRLKKQLQDKFNQDVAALERVWALVRGNRENGSEHVERTQVQDVVAQVLPMIEGEFVLEDVVEKLKALGPDTQGVEKKAVSTALRRLADLHEQIEVLEAGIGRRPTRYRRLVATS